MTVYLASPLRNHIANALIAEELRHCGIPCFLPQDEAYNYSMQEAGDTARHLAQVVYQNNVAAIDAADTVVVVARGIGTDTAWECGYAVARNKAVILVHLDADSIEHMYMLQSAIPSDRHIRLTALTRENLAALVRLIRLGSEDAA